MAIPNALERYYTHQGRVESFASAQSLSKRRSSTVSSKAPKSIKWPHSFLSPEEMAKAGFFHYPTQESPDNTVCFLCENSLDGWEQDDDPLKEHLKHSPNCGWAIVASIDAQDSELSNEYPLSTRMIEARKATFGNRWPHEGKKGWKCKIKQMVDAGWKYTPTLESDDLATCAYCDLALDGWEPSDKPLDEHHNRSPSCAFFTLVSGHQINNSNKKSSRKPRASKASRYSTQSTFTTASEVPSLADHVAEEEDSIATRGTTATVSSQTARKMAQGKKSAKSGKTRAKKGVAAENIAMPEPEDDGYEVKLEPSKAPRGKKRTSEVMTEISALEDAQQPPNKRRGARATRGSMAIHDDRPAPAMIENNVDTTMASADDIFPVRKAMVSKKGRSSAAKSRRNVSTASTASKASLRTHIPDDDEIERALQADLERPLTDEEELDLTTEVSNTYRLEQSSIIASVVPVRKGTRASKIRQADHDMLATTESPLDEAIEAEESMQREKTKAPKIKQSRKPSAKQQAAAKREAEMSQVDGDDEAAARAQDQLAEEMEGRVGPKARKVKKNDPVATTHNIPARATRASVLTVNENNVSAMSTMDNSNNIGNDSDASIASQSTVVIGNAARRGSTLKKGRGGKRVVSRNIEEIITPSIDTAPSQQNSTGTVKKKPVGRAKKVVVAEQILNEDDPIQSISEELHVPLPYVAATKSMQAKSKGMHRVLQEIPPEPESESAHPTADPAFQSPKRAPREITPPLSPQSSDAENQPPSSKPSAIKPAVHNSQASRVPLAASTPTGSLSKRSIVEGLRSTHQWTAVDLDEILLKTPSDMDEEKENSMPNLIAEALGKAQKGDLTSPEKKMTVEEWVLFNATLAEDKLRSDCERMVGIFEREGGRAMRVLEGIECVE